MVFLKKTFSNIIILIIIVLGTTFWYNYSNNKDLKRNKSRYESHLKYVFKNISDILGEYKDANMEKKISLASNLSYNLYDSIKSYYDNSYIYFDSPTLEDQSLKGILYKFESNIKENNMGILLDNDITNDLSLLFNELSINPFDITAAEEINKILSVYWE